MNRNTLRTVHKTGAIIAILCIASFWTSTVISELFLSHTAVAWVKNAIAYGVFILIAAMAATGATGMKMGGKSKHSNIVAKKKRMPVIAANGLLVLLPCAFYLFSKANAGEFDGMFYTLQAVELLAGAVNFTLLALSVKDGINIRKPKIKAA